MELYALVYKKGENGKEIIQHTWVTEMLCDAHVKRWNEHSPLKARKVVFKSVEDREKNA